MDAQNIFPALMGDTIRRVFIVTKERRLRALHAVRGKSLFQALFHMSPALSSIHRIISG